MEGRVEDIVLDSIESTSHYMLSEMKDPSQIMNMSPPEADMQQDSKSELV